MDAIDRFLKRARKSKSAADSQLRKAVEAMCSRRCSLCGAVYGKRSRRMAREKLHILASGRYRFRRRKKSAQRYCDACRESLARPLPDHTRWVLNMLGNSDRKDSWALPLI
jgi:hypothetical protein